MQTQLHSDALQAPTSTSQPSSQFESSPLFLVAYLLSHGATIVSANRRGRIISFRLAGVDNDVLDGFYTNLLTPIQTFLTRWDYLRGVVSGKHPLPDYQRADAEVTHAIFEPTS